MPQSDVPGEKTSPTQPFPTKPPAYARNFFNVPDDLIDFTPELRAEAKDVVARYQVGPMFLPPMIGNNNTLGSLTLGKANGGTNWPGAGYDPETHIVYAQANQSAFSVLSLRTPPQGFSDIRYVLGRNETDFRVSEGPGFGTAADAPQASGRGRGAGRGGAGPSSPTAPAPAVPAPARAGVLTVQGLSILKPPYGVISAIDLDRGELKWQVPYGETPDVVRNQPGAQGSESSQHRPRRKRRPTGHQDAGDSRRQSDYHYAAASSGRDAARLRQSHRQGSRLRVDAGAAERIADDLYGRGQAVHRCCRERRSLLG